MLYNLVDTDSYQAAFASHRCESRGRGPSENRENARGLLIIIRLIAFESSRSFTNFHSDKYCLSTSYETTRVSISHRICFDFCQNYFAIVIRVRLFVFFARFCLVLLRKWKRASQYFKVRFKNKTTRVQQVLLKDQRNAES